jgi:uncharacterized protein YprB with RNaseH-like and TPR domain
MKRIEIFDRTRSSRPLERGKKTSRRDEASLFSLAERLDGRVVKEGTLSLLEVEQAVGKDLIHGTVRLGSVDDIPEATLSILFPAACGEDGKIAGKSFLFFDIETTGLSTGAGTRFFLIGMLKVSSGEIRLLQYFLADLRSEPLFLRRVKEYFSGDDVLVSYNGKSFDYNVIRNRYILNGLGPDDEKRAHLDLLYTSRRLWRGICPDFTLGTVERTVLGFNRHGDIPGEKIPDIYSRYLREGYTGDDLYRVFVHNRNDILSLLALLLKQVHTVDEGMVSAGEVASVNRVSLSDMLSRSGFHDEAKHVLMSKKRSAEAAKKLGLLFKRERAYREALEHFMGALKRSESVSDYVFACTEIAKIYEHTLRDFEAALAYAGRARDRLLRGEVLYPKWRHGMKEDLAGVERRIVRLEGKIKRAIARGEQGGVPYRRIDCNL